MMGAYDTAKLVGWILNFGLSMYYFFKDDYPKATFFLVAAVGMK